MVVDSPKVVLTPTIMQQINPLVVMLRLPVCAGRGSGGDERGLRLEEALGLREAL